MQVLISSASFDGKLMIYLTNWTQKCVPFLGSYIAFILSKICAFGFENSLPMSCLIFQMHVLLQIFPSSFARSFPCGI